MGCCPSKVTKNAECKAEAGSTATGASIQTEDSNHVTILVMPDNQSEHVAAPTNLLMDRGDGQRLEKSDRVIENHPHEDASSKGTTTKVHTIDIVVMKEPSNQQHSWTAPTIDTDQDLELIDAIPYSPPKPLSPAMSPEEMPIDSMYHRLHLAKVAEQDARRQEELRREAEEREREVREFKAAMMMKT